MTSAADAEGGGALACGVLAGGVLELGALAGGDVCSSFGGSVGADPPAAFAAGTSGTSLPGSSEADAGVEPDAVAAAGAAVAAAGAAVAEPLAGTGPLAGGALALAGGSELALELVAPDGAELPLAIEASNGDPSTPLPQPLSATTETQTQQNFRMTTPR
jgi:hypothetical protein